MKLITFGVVFLEDDLFFIVLVDRMMITIFERIDMRVNFNVEDFLCERCDGIVNVTEFVVYREALDIQSKNSAYKNLNLKEVVALSLNKLPVAYASNRKGYNHQMLKLRSQRYPIREVIKQSFKTVASNPLIIGGDNPITFRQVGDDLELATARKTLRLINRILGKNYNWLQLFVWVKKVKQEERNLRKPLKSFRKSLGNPRKTINLAA